MTPRKVRAQSAAAERRLAATWNAILVSMHNARTLEELAILLAAGRFDEAVQTVVAHARRFAAAFNAEYTGAATATADDIEAALRSAARGEVIVDFDMTNDSAVRAMKENRLRLVREISDQQRRASAEAITDGVQRGVNPREMARAFRSSIGLTQHQVRAVNNYRRLLETNNSEALQRKLRDRRFDRTVSSAIADKQPLTKPQIDNMVAQYRKRYEKYRRETIARTESLRAVHEGTFGMFKQAIDAGHVTANELVREWNTAADERVRSTHAAMQGQTVRGLEEQFTSGAGNKTLHPGGFGIAEEDIQCRCTVGVRMDLGQSPGVMVQMLEGAQ